MSIIITPNNDGESVKVLEEAKSYTDDVIDTRLPLSGGDMTGVIRTINAGIRNATDLEDGSYWDLVSTFCKSTGYRVATIRIENNDGNNAILIGTHDESNGAPTGILVKNTNGTVTVILGNQTIGNATTPVYMKAGVITSTGKSFDSYLAKSGGTMTGTLTTANTAIGTSAARNIYATTTDLTAGSSALTTGRICLVYS